MRKVTGCICPTCGTTELSGTLIADRNKHRHNARSVRIGTVILNAAGMDVDEFTYRIDPKRHTITLSPAEVKP